MRMSFGQEMRMAQKQVLAPRMIQSMEILQLPVMALEERIEEAIAEALRSCRRRSGGRHGLVLADDEGVRCHAGGRWLVDSSPAMSLGNHDDEVEAP
jgi:hypothetical protein